MALGQDRQDLPLADRGRVGIRRRAGTTTPYSFGDSADELGDYAWYVENAEKPMPVGKKKPNPWGLHDMHGNVAEWCIDLYKPDAYAEFAKMAQPVKEPVVLPTPKEYPYVARGGSWDDDADKLRSAARNFSNPNGRCRTPSAPRASGGTPTRPASASGSSVRSRSRKISKGSARWL